MNFFDWFFDWFKAILNHFWLFLGHFLNNFLTDFRPFWIIFRPFLGHFESFLTDFELFLNDFRSFSSQFNPTFCACFLFAGGSDWSWTRQRESVREWVEWDGVSRGWQTTLHSHLEMLYVHLLIQLYAYTHYCLFFL